MDGTNVVNTSPDSSTKELASPSFLRVLFGVLAVVGILSGPVWIFFDPGNLELGEFGYLGLTFVIIPTLSFFWLFALHFFKQWSADNRRTSKFLVIGVIFLFAGLLIASHDSIRGLAFRPDIVFGPLRYWHEYVLVVMAAGWILGFGWLILKRKNLLQAVCGHMLFILVLGIFLPSVLAGYAQAKVAKASLWKKSAVTEDACSAIISRDRYDCFQALGAGKQDLSYCSDSRPDLSCVRPFSLKGDYSFCKGDLLSRGNPKGWIPGEVEVVAGGVSKYEAKFGLDDSQMVQLYCVAGLLHQKWRADCDWLSEEMASVCRNQEVGEACKFLDGKSGLACITALDGEDLFTRNWFDRNFHIWSKQINFYTDGKSFEHLGYLKMPLGLRNSAQVFDQDSLQKDILIKRILYLMPDQGNIGAMFFGVASKTASLESLESQIFLSNYQLRETPVLSDRQITFLGVPARLRVYGNANTYPLKVTFRVLSFSYKDSQYVLLFDSSSNPVDWRDFTKGMSLQTIWQ